MGTVAENGNGCGNGCEKNFMKNTWLSENFLIPLHRQNQGLKAGRCPIIGSNNFIKPLSNIKNGNNKNKLSKRESTIHQQVRLWLWRCRLQLQLVVRRVISDDFLYWRVWHRHGGSGHSYARFPNMGCRQRSTYRKFQRPHQVALGSLSPLVALWRTHHRTCSCALLLGSSWDGLYR